MSPVIGFHTKKIMKCSAQIPSQEIPASLPAYCWVLLSSVMAMDLPGHVFIRSRTSFGLDVLQRRLGQQFHHSHLYHPASLHPISLAPAVQAHLLQDSHQQNLTPQYQHRCDGKHHIYRSKANHSSQKVTHHWRSEKTSQSCPLYTPLWCASAANTLLQCQHWALEWNPTLRSAFSN